MFKLSDGTQFAAEKTLRLFYFAMLAIGIPSTAFASSGEWETTLTPLAFVQIYPDAEQRKSQSNIGAYLNADYLESAGVAFGYSYSSLTFTDDANLAEHLFYLSGRRHYFPDALPGKLTLRMDAYLGTQTLSYVSGKEPSVPSSGKKDKKIVANVNTRIEETTDISAYQAQAAFTNYAKTFYLDLGYAWSHYNGATVTETSQWTPTIGIGWNDSYDWLQLRTYHIDVNNTDDTDNDQYQALEFKYTRWHREHTDRSLEFVQFAVMTGDRIFAVDPDAAAVYSTTDKQTAGLTASAQWRLTEHSEILMLTSYNQYTNEFLGDDYQSLLFYINLQYDW